MTLSTRIFARRPDFGAIIGVALLFVVFSLIDFSGWWSGRTLGNILQFTAILGCIAIGQAIVIMVKEIDLSVGSVYGLTGIAYITLEADLGIPGAMLAAMTIAGSIGFLQAMAVIKGKIPSMIVTLGGLFAARGLIYVWTGGSVRTMPADSRAHWLNQLFGGELFGIDAAILWLALLIVLLSLVVWRTKFGNRLLATGGDENTALSQGIRTDRVKTVAFVLCSLLAGFAAILTLADDPRTHVTLGDLMELEAIAAAVIGGCLLTGGRGSLLGAVLGAFIITSVRYQMISLGAPASWYITFVGLVVIAALIFNQFLARWATKQA
ncbi:ABC transporter permease [Halomonas heilongjiangensis]|uniref:Autoinducer 2 import system permease protein LsrC n=1 Tax=Halomonas heilongjiangensis TaxID=1387883 RepID=A0A2N7TK90_9GAMM|nr:ABC transporter permease [Halomonas heilongjiangensis]PMR68616.1 sugar ABC transporter [Halomonas heilongjiangensis]PXX89189.1 sugar ABC transporter [Halomonas heilongjiangensis]